MNLKQNYLTENNCYKKGEVLKPAGIMVHSTGCNLPHADQWAERWNTAKPGGTKKCVHAFVDNDGVVQTLPWTMRGWHAGKRAGNDRYIGFEICEDTLEDGQYFAAAYANAVALCALLCRQFDLDPMKAETVICHSEGYQQGVASNHADVMHWFPRHGKSMDGFRRDVQAKLTADTAPVRQPASSYTGVVTANDYLNVRTYGSMEAIVLDQLPRGTQVGIGLVDGTWGNLYGYGWVGLGYVKRISGNALPKNGTVKVNSTLNVRKGPGTDYDKLRSLRNGTAVRIVATYNGWGLLSDGGWVSLSYIR